MKYFYALICLTFCLVSPATVDIMPKAAFDLVQKAQAILLDVREEAEISESGKAQGAVVLPMSEVNSGSALYQNAIKKLPTDKTIIVYCKSGRRAQAFIDKHAKTPFRFRNMGAFADWLNAGLPVE